MGSDTSRYMDDYAIEASVDLLSRHSIRNNLYLAGHEFRDLSRPFDWGLLAPLGSRLHVMGCANDTWLSRQQYDDMCERLPGLQVRGAKCGGRQVGGACTNWAMVPGVMWVWSVGRPPS